MVDFVASDIYWFLENMDYQLWDRNSIEGHANVNIEQILGSRFYLIDMALEKMEKEKLILQFKGKWTINKRKY